MKPSQIPEALAVAREINRPVIFTGPPGVGKSQSVQQYAADNDLQLVDIRLSTYDPTEIKGVGVPDLKRNLMVWLINEVFPRDAKSKGLLFFDELTAAPLATQAAAYQLFLDRGCGTYRIPDGWQIAAAGNDVTHRAVAYRMSSALANRLIHAKVEVDFEAFREWAFDNDIATDIIAYLSMCQHHLMTFDPTSNDPVFASPRTWHYASDLYKATGLRTETSVELMKGTIGEGLTMQFLGFVKQKDQLVDIKDIERNPKTAKIPDEVSGRFAVTAMLGTVVDPKRFEKFLTYMERMNIENQTVFVRAALNKDKRNTENAAYKTWAMKNNRILLGV